MQLAQPLRRRPRRAWGRTPRAQLPRPLADEARRPPPTTPRRSPACRAARPSPSHRRRERSSCGPGRRWRRTGRARRSVASASAARAISAPRLRACRARPRGRRTGGAARRRPAWPGPPSPGDTKRANSAAEMTGAATPCRDRLVHRPATLAGVGRDATDAAQVWVVLERLDQQVEQPGPHDAALAPGAERGVRVDLQVGGFHDGVALGVGLHHPVLDPVVDHLDVVARARPDRRGRTRPPGPARRRSAARSRRPRATPPTMRQ